MAVTISENYIFVKTEQSRKVRAYIYGSCLLKSLTAKTNQIVIDITFQFN